jgi:mannose-1-phosphate guanylyltransferase
LGTGGAVKNVEKHIDGQFLVINGDSISSLDIAKFLEFHLRKKAFATISLWPVDDPTPYGVVDLDENERIRRFQEKPKREEAFSNLINAGAYALEYEVLDHIGKGFVSMEREVFPKIVDRGMYGMTFDGYWIDCGRREDLLKAFWTLMGENTLELSKQSVHEGSDLRKPAVVKKGAVVAGAVIGPHTYISERAVVGLRSSVERSVLLEDARVGARCRIYDSIIDSGVAVPDGAEVVSKILSNAKEEERQE